MGERVVRVFHISDLHMRSAKGPQKERARLEAASRWRVGGDEWKRNLLNLQADGVPFDLVVFTGDLGDWGHPTDYPRATELLKETCATLNVPLERLFVVPGNHDVDRTLQPAVWESLRREIAKNPRAYSTWMAGDDRGALRGDPRRDQILERQQAFWGAVTEELGRSALKPAASPHGRLGYQQAVMLDGLTRPVHVIGLDTAWLAGDEHDGGQLRLTEHQVALLTTTPNGAPLPGLRLALMHHRIADLADAAESRRLLADRVDLLLHGHQHEPTADLLQGPDGQLLVLAAGCLYEGDEAHRYLNACHVIDLVVDENARPRRAGVRFRGWSARNYFWGDDSLLYRNAPDGRLRLRRNERGWHFDEQSPAPFLVPFRDNESSFRGREHELAAMHEQLTKRGIVGLQGMGGVGKTGLAARYVYKHRGDHAGGVYWINGAGSDWRHELAKLARELQLAPIRANEDEDEGFAAAFIKYLRGQSDALLVVDNVHDPKELYEDTAAGASLVSLGCRVLYTSRRRQPGPTIDIGVLPFDQARALLLSRLGALAVHADHVGMADAICQRLGYLPLALVLAAAYLDENQAVLTLAGYAKLLDLKGALAVDEHDLDDAEVRALHWRRIGAAFELQLTAITSSEAKHLLEVAAVMPEAEALPIARLSLFSGLAAKAVEDPGLTALRWLVRWSLVDELQPGAVRLHPLMRAFVRDRAQEAGSLAELERQSAQRAANIERLDEEVSTRDMDEVIDDVALACRLAGLRDGVQSTEVTDHTLEWKVRLGAVHAFLVHHRNFLARHPKSFLDQAARDASLRRLRMAPRPRRLEVIGVSGRRRRTAGLRIDDQVFHVATISGDGRLAISASKEGLTAYDAVSGRVVSRYSPGEGTDFLARRLASDFQGRIVVAALESGELLFWNRERDKVTSLAPFRQQGVWRAHLGRCYARGFEDGTLEVEVSTTQIPGNNGWLFGRPAEFWRQRSDADNYTCHTTPDGYMITGHRNGGVYLHAPERGAICNTQSELSKRSDLICVSASNDGRVGVAGYRDGALEAWDLSSASPLFSERPNHSSVTSVGVEPSGRWIAASFADGTVLRRALGDRTGRDEWIAIARFQIALVTPDAGFLIAHLGRTDFHAAAIAEDGTTVISGEQDGIPRTEGVRHVWLDPEGLWCVATGGDDLVGGYRVQIIDVDRPDAARTTWVAARAAAIDVSAKAAFIVDPAGRVWRVALLTNAVEPCAAVSGVIDLALAEPGVLVMVNRDEMLRIRVEGERTTILSRVRLGESMRILAVDHTTDWLVRGAKIFERRSARIVQVGTLRREEYFPETEQTTVFSPIARRGVTLGHEGVVHVWVLGRQDRGSADEWFAHAARLVGTDRALFEWGDMMDVSTLALHRVSDGTFLQGLPRGAIRQYSVSNDGMVRTVLPNGQQLAAACRLPLRFGWAARAAVALGVTGLVSGLVGLGGWVSPYVSLGVPIGCLAAQAATVILGRGRRTRDGALIAAAKTAKKLTATRNGRWMLLEHRTERHSEFTVADLEIGRIAWRAEEPHWFESRLVLLTEDGERIVGLRSNDSFAVATRPRSQEVASFATTEWCEPHIYSSVIWAFSTPDGRHVLLIPIHKLPRLLDLDGERLLELEEARPISIPIAFHAETGRIAAASAGVLWIWREADGALLCKIPAHTHKVNGLAFSPDGSMLASSADDHVIAVANAASGAELAALHLDDRGAACVITDEGRLLVSALDGTVSAMRLIR